METSKENCIESSVIFITAKIEGNPDGNTRSLLELDPTI
tara:strand:- start:364 stop:480 length:117 start_codon:yes stop_codon:yes gene_type:complete